MAGRKIPIFKGYKRLNQRVQLTKKGLIVFPGEPLGILVRLAGDGRWVVKRDGQQNAYYWHRKWWKRVSQPTKW